MGDNTGMWQSQNPTQAFYDGVLWALKKSLFQHFLNGKDTSLSSVLWVKKTCLFIAVHWIERHVFCLAWLYSISNTDHLHHKKTFTFLYPFSYTACSGNNMCTFYQFGYIYIFLLILLVCLCIHVNFSCMYIMDVLNVTMHMNHWPGHWPNELSDGL